MDMSKTLTTTELNDLQTLLQTYPPAQIALATLTQHNGQLDISFDQLWAQSQNIQTYDRTKSVWVVTLNVLRQELCGDDSFRSKILDYNKNPASASAFTGLIVYLAQQTHLPLNPAIATILLLYILKIGINIFCEYTEPQSK
jgi:hypothetical protein